MPVNFSVFHCYFSIKNSFLFVTDDIFADSLPSKKESTVRKDNGAPKKSEKPTSNKISSIFDDDDDDTSLFDDPLSVKSK